MSWAERQREIRAKSLRLEENIPRYAARSFVDALFGGEGGDRQAEERFARQRRKESRYETLTRLRVALRGLRPVVLAEGDASSTACMCRPR